MTKQEAIEKLREFCKLRAFCELYPDACKKDDCEIYMAIEALSEPSRQGQRDGSISRQAAIDICRAPHMRNADCSDFEMAIMMLPPAQPKLLQPWEVLAAQAVLPQPKMGKWIYHIDDLFPAENTMECNQCHAEQPLTCDDEFCPHCGAKMEVTE